MVDISRSASISLFLEAPKMRTLVTCAIATIFVVSLAAVSAQAQEPPSVDGANACSTGSTGWDHCEHTYVDAGFTWCWLKNADYWVRASTDVHEQLLISAAASAHWVLFNITSCPGGAGVWSYGRLWEF